MKRVYHALMTTRGPRKDTREVRQTVHRTRPPRLEGKVKEAMMQPKKKPSRERAKKGSHGSQKPQGYTEQERKDYQLRSQRR